MAPPAQLAQHQREEENMDARPDQEEMEQAIDKFLQLLEKQEKKKGLKHLQWRLVFSQHWTKIRPICSPRQSCACTNTLRTTGYYYLLVTRGILGYPSLLGDILGQHLISKVQVDSGRTEGCHSLFEAAGLRPSRHRYHQPPRMAVGEETSTRSTRGCGSLGAEASHWGLSVSETGGKARRNGGRQGRGEDESLGPRPAAAAGQPGAEMNETDGMSTSEGISQDKSFSNYYPDLSRVLQVLQSYPNLSRDMQV